MLYQDELRKVWGEYELASDEDRLEYRAKAMAEAKAEVCHLWRRERQKPSTCIVPQRWRSSGECLAKRTAAQEIENIEVRQLLFTERTHSLT
jgi:hypothetical protein